MIMCCHPFAEEDPPSAPSDCECRRRRDSRRRSSYSCRIVTISTLFVYSICILLRGTAEGAFLKHHHHHQHRHQHALFSSRHRQQRRHFQSCLLTRTIETSRDGDDLVMTRRIARKAGLRDDDYDDDIYEEGESPRSVIVTATASTASTAMDNFHQDMIRVLESRASLLEPFLIQSQERRNRPVVLQEDVDGAERVHRMLRHLLIATTNRDTNENVSPVSSALVVSETSFQIVMRAYVRRHRMRWYDRQDDNLLICAADKVPQLLQQLQQIQLQQSQQQQQQQSKPKISLETYNLVLQAYATCATPRGERHYARRAHELLSEMEIQHGTTIPTTTAFTTSLMHVLHAYAWEQANLDSDSDCAQQAQLLLERIETIANSSSSSSSSVVSPRILMQCYNWVLEAWSKSGSEGSAEKADALFCKMKELNETLSKEASDNNGNDDAFEDNDNTVKTNQLLDAQTYSNAILAWSKATTPEATQRCNELLLELLQKHKEGAFSTAGSSEPPLIAFNGVITAWARAGRPDKAEQVLMLLQQLRPSCRDLTPDAVTYNSVLHAHLASNNKTKALEKVLALVQYMEDNYHPDQPAIRPNCFTYYTLLKCIVQSGKPNIAQEAENTLIQMERQWEAGDTSVEPNTRIFNMVINAYAKSNNNDRFASARKALDLLRRMSLSNKKEYRPDNISYTSVLECLSKSADPTAPQQAQALLEELFALHEKTGDPAHLPNLRTFTMAILTFAKNNGSVATARSLLTQLVALYEQTQDEQLRPNEFPYNYVLNCAANTFQDNPSEAFRLATETYQEMRKSKLVKPDTYTYAFWIKCCNNLLPQGDLRNKCISYAFEECKKAGLVTNEVLTRLFQGSSGELVDEILQLKRKTNYRSLQIEQLPPQWSKNAAPRARKKQPTMHNK